MKSEKLDIDLSKDLKRLANEFEKNDAILYIVGGKVRNTLLNLSSQDIDITSSIKPDKVLAICKKLKFSAKVVNEKLGTVLIQTKNESYEYTCFRIENYPKGGEHTPSSTEFVEDIKLDANRRDFTINAIYLNIQTGELVDFFKGLKDIKKRKLKAILSPKQVFENDGLRLLRLIRFSTTYGLVIDRKTLKCAKKFNYQLKDISKERILKELKQIVLADTIYNLRAPKNFSELLNYLDLYKYIYNENFKSFKLNLLKDYFDIPSEFRYYYFNLLIIEKYLKNSIKHKNEISNICNELLGTNGLKDSNESIKNITDLYFIYQHRNNFNDLPHREQVKIIIEYNRLNSNLKEFFNNFKEFNESIKNKITELENRNIPTSINQLKISNKNLLNLKINPKYISKIKEQLFIKCANEKVENNKRELSLLAIEEERECRN